MFTDLKTFFSSFKPQKPQKDPEKHKWTSGPVTKVLVLSASFTTKNNKPLILFFFFRFPCLEMKTNFYPALRQTDMCCTQVQRTKVHHFSSIQISFTFPVSNWKEFFHIKSPDLFLMLILVPRSHSLAGK